jgi:hypothetical protein
MKKPLKLALKSWTLDDAEFVCEVRNRPELRRWFRQEENLHVEAQKAFILHQRFYMGKIVYSGRKRVGVAALRFIGPERELCIAAPLEYHKAIVKLLLKDTKFKVVGEVFVGNPALKTYLDLGFEIVGVKERAYYKRDFGLQDVVLIERDAHMGSGDVQTNRSSKV